MSERPYLSDFSGSAAPHLQTFIAAAKYFLGLTEDPPGSNLFTDSRGQEIFDLAHSTAVYAYPPTAWCALLVTACEVIAEIDWKILGPGEGVGGITSYSVDAYGAEWIEGPYFTRSAVYPQPGDLISFVGSPASTYSGYEHGGHIGIVEWVDDGGVHTIEGNAGDCCCRNTYAFDYDDINGYVRADWAAVGDDVSQYGGDSGGGSGGGSGSGGKKKRKKKKGPLYTSRNDRHDMTLRQVGYLDGNYQLSNSSSSVAISVINYTSLLGDLYDRFAPESYEEYDTEEGVNVDTSNLEGNIKISVDFFLENDFSASAASALTGCLYSYSQLNVAFSKDLGMIGGEMKRLQGIGGWPNPRWQWVRERLGDDRYSLSNPGQLDCVRDELSKDYPQLLSAIQHRRLSPQDTQDVVELVIKNYNDYFDSEPALKRAKESAAEIYKSLIITKKSSGYAGGKDLRDIDGRVLSPQFTTDIPADVEQTGIILEWLSYSQYYDGPPPSTWGAGTPERALADNWAYQGFPYDRSIALVGGYYCVAVKPRFGAVGDVIVVTLENGESFAAIIADHKGDDATSEWGHMHGSGVSIIEWCAIVTYDGKIQTGSQGAGSVYIDLTADDLGSWYGQNVTSITNYGSYLW